MDNDLIKSIFLAVIGGVFTGLSFFVHRTISKTDKIDVQAQILARLETTISILSEQMKDLSHSIRELGSLRVEVDNLKINQQRTNGGRIVYNRGGGNIRDDTDDA